MLPAMMSFVNKNRLVLSLIDAPDRSPDSRPPGSTTVVVDNRIGSGKVETDATGFQTDKENRHFTGLKTSHSRFPARRITGQMT